MARSPRVAYCKHCGLRIVKHDGVWWHREVDSIASYTTCKTGWLNSAEPIST